MNRRDALGAVGTGVVALTAGCAGFGRGAAGGLATGDEPTFETAVTAPSTLILGATFSATVTVTNTGDGVGTYEGTLRAFTGMLDEVERPVSVGPIPPGERGETTVGPMVAGYAGGWAVELDGETRSLDVLPARFDAGERLELADQLAISVDSITVRDGYDYVTADGEAGSRRAEDGFAFVFGRLRVENLGSTARATPSRSEFAGASVDGFYPVYFGPERWDEIQFGGHPYPGRRRITAGESSTGWLVLTVAAPDETAVGVAWNRDRVTSPPEAVWRA